MADTLELTLDQVLADPKLSTAFVAERGRQDFAFFCREILGYKDMAAEHEELCWFIQHHPALFKLILMPRYTFKSCLATTAYSLWLLANNPSLRILIYSSSSTLAQTFLVDIKNHILHLNQQSLFRAVYGDWEVDPKRGVWNQSAIVVKPRIVAHAEPSIDTSGIETSRVGAHYDVIIFDDLVVKENVTTKDLMDKVYDCYKTALSLLKPQGQVMMIGTRWHFGDMYGRLLAEDRTSVASPGGKRLATYIRDGEVSPTGTPFPFASIGLTKDFLLQQKELQGSYIYSCLYRNEPTDPETAVFKTQDFAFYDPTQRLKDAWVQSLFITCCVDPAISQATDADQTAITVVGTDADWNLYLLDAEAGRMLPDDILETIFNLATRWRFQVLGIETTAYQKMLAQELHRRRWQQRQQSGTWQNFRIEEFSGISTRSKEQRIQGLQPYHEGHRLKFPGTSVETLEGVWSTLAYQLIQFPHSAKDDLMDSLAYHIFIARTGSLAQPTQVIPWNSPAGLERAAYDKEVTVMGQRPRWLRRPVDALVFS